MPRIRPSDQDTTPDEHGEHQRRQEWARRMAQATAAPDGDSDPEESSGSSSPPEPAPPKITYTKTVDGVRTQNGMPLDHDEVPPPPDPDRIRHILIPIGSPSIRILIERGFLDPSQVDDDDALYDAIIGFLRAAARAGVRA
jgi:hypothetical protein